MRDKVITSAAPAPIGPYSQAVRANGFIFVSGQIPLDPVTGEIVPGGVAQQAEQALRNMANLLQAAGSSTADVVRCVVYLKNMADFAAMNKVYARFFDNDPPARTAIAVSSLPKDALIEIEATARIRAIGHENKSVKTLGIVGGLGPESTIEYYRLLIAGYRNRSTDGADPPLLINSIDVKKLLALVAASERARLVKYLVGSLLPLARAGADFALLAANTPHIVFPEVAKESPLPLISIVEAACDFAEARKFTKVGLFGTRSTMQAGFYQKVFREREIEIALPDVDEQNYIHDKYVGELVIGRYLPETRERLIAIAKRLRDREGIDALILGGTELPLLLRDDVPVGIPFLDTTRIHVQAALDQMFS